MCTNNNTTEIFLNEPESTKQYFEYKGVKILITEHFNRDGKSLEETIKEAIIRDSKTDSQ